MAHYDHFPELWSFTAHGINGMNEQMEVYGIGLITYAMENQHLK